MTQWPPGFPAPSPLLTPPARSSAARFFGVAAALLAVVAIVLPLVGSSPASSGAGGTGGHGGSSGTGSNGSTGQAGAAQLAAEVGVRASDLPASWSVDAAQGAIVTGMLHGFGGSPQKATSGSAPGAAKTTFDTKLNACAGTTALPSQRSRKLGQSTSPVFAAAASGLGENTQIGSTTAVFATPRGIDKLRAAVSRPGFSACVAGVMNTYINATLQGHTAQGMTVTSAALAPVVVPQSPSSSAFGVQITISESLGAVTEKPRLGFVYVAGGSVISFLCFSSLTTTFTAGVLDKVVSGMENRIDGVGSGVGA